jgi:hypothetical protein
MPPIRAHLEARAHPGWEATGNLSPSPDHFQYRVWARRTQVTGPLVDNRFTAEPTPKHLLVLYYWAVGQVARVTGLTPDRANILLGMFMAGGLVLLIYAACRRFLEPPASTWAFLLALFAGGFGAWLSSSATCPIWFRGSGG